MTSRPLVTQADASGRFTFCNLPPGSYYLDASDEEAGYPYSQFAFYILPGQSKPEVAVEPGTKTKEAVIQLGERVAYLDLVIPGLDLSGVRLTLVRPDIPGPFSLSWKSGSLFPVPPVPFTLEVDKPGYKPWVYSKDGTKEITPKSGEIVTVTADLVAEVTKP